MSKSLELSGIFVTVLISAVFTIICNLWWFVYNIVQAAGICLKQLTYGVRFIAAVVYYLIIPKPGIVLLTGIIARAGETIVMGKFDMPTIIYVILQGLACEIIFVIFKYKSRSAAVAMLAGLITTSVSFPVDYFYDYLNEVTRWSLLLFMVFRSINGIILAGLILYWIVEALDKTGATKFFRPASQQDYDSL